MTTATIRRAETVENADGDPVAGAFEDWKTFAPPSDEVFVAWGNPDEPLEVGRNTVITSRTVYIRTAEPTGILASDQVIIDGVEYAIEGTVAEWSDPDGYVGAQFAIRAVS